MTNEEFKQFKTNFIAHPIMDVDVIKSLTNYQLSELFSEMSTTPNQKVNEIKDNSNEQ
jgi:hypothetical protein